ncbi:MAG: hypothetical protein ACJ8R9_26975 [Steroidobacteraceae bacterium]
MTDDDIRHFQDLFQALLSSSDGSSRIETLFFEAVMLAGLGDVVYLEGVPRRMTVCDGEAHSPREMNRCWQPRRPYVLDSVHNRKMVRSAG